MKYVLRSTGGYRVNFTFDSMAELRKVWIELSEKSFKVGCSDGRAGTSLWKLGKTATWIVAINTLTLEVECTRVHPRP